MASTKESPQGVTEGTMLQVGQRIRPEVSLQQATQLAETLYGVQVTSVKELDSYDDRNFLIQIREDYENPHLTWCPHGYVFKVLNSMDSQKQHVDAEHEIQRMLHREGIPCPQPVLNVHGRDKDLRHLAKDGNDNEADQSVRNVVRLLTFIPGQILGNVQSTPMLLEDLGQTLARIHTVLKDYNHPALQGHQTVWSLASVPSLRQFAYVIKDEQRHSMVLDIIAAFETEVLNNMTDGSFRRGVIHGDPNEQNTLVSSVTLEDGRKDLAICGMLDFGDVQDSYLLFDLAIAIMYALVAAGDLTEEQVTQVAGHILTGYLSGQKLPEAEWNVLPLSVCARMVQSLVLGAYSYSLDPGNEYLLVTAASGWPLLKTLWTTPAAKWRHDWAKVCQQNGCHVPQNNNNNSE